MAEEGFVTIEALGMQVSTPVATTTPTASFLEELALFQDALTKFWASHKEAETVLDKIPLPALKNRMQDLLQEYSSTVVRLTDRITTDLKRATEVIKIVSAGHEKKVLTSGTTGSEHPLYEMVALITRMREINGQQTTPQDTKEKNEDLQEKVLTLLHDSLFFVETRGGWLEEWSSATSSFDEEACTDFWPTVRSFACFCLNSSFSITSNKLVGKLVALCHYEHEPSE